MNKTIIGKLGLIILLSICQNRVYSQQLLNFDFEKTSIEHSIRPWGWNKTTNASTDIGMDSIVKYEGKYSFRMQHEQNSDNEKLQTLSFGFEPYQLHEKIITITGRIKTEKLTGEAYFSVSYSDKVSEMWVDSVSEIFSNTTDWSLVSINLFIPKSTQAVYLKIHHQGIGTAWFDDFALIVDNMNLNEVEVAQPFSTKELEWIENASSPIYAVDATKTGAEDVQSFEDLFSFKNLVANAQLIALGESTHGTSEFFRLKHRVLEYSVKELGVRIFGLEGNMLIVEKINKYVLGGEGSARVAMKGIFLVWYNDEVHSMVEWVRNYNDSNPFDKVEFVGYDMQDLTSPMDSLHAFLERKSSKLLEITSDLLKEFREDGDKGYMMSDSIKLQWYENSVEVLENIKSHKDEWLRVSKDKSDSLDVYWGIQYANLLKQFAESTYKGFRSFYRDEAMAENISWFLSVRKPGTRMLIWAHDYHISKGEHPNDDFNIYNGLSMGSHLWKKYGENYKAFALSTFEGDYWAMVGYRDFRQMKCPLHISPKGTLDEALHQLTIKNNSIGMFLDLSKARTLNWLTHPIPMRFANHVNIEYGYWTRYSIPYQFDGIFFIDKTTSAKPLTKNN